MNKITCAETNKINKQDSDLFADIIYNNFEYLTKFPELQHTKKDILDIFNQDILCYLLYDGKKLIGYLVGDFRTIDTRYVFYLSYVYIKQDYRNRKLGSELMNRLIKKCKDHGTKFIVLTCDTNDKKVVNFYKKLGFVIDKIHGGNKRHNVYCLYL